MNLNLQTQPATEFGDDFFEVKNVAPHAALLDALALFKRIGLNEPMVFGGSMRDVLHGLPFKDIDVLGCYSEIKDAPLAEIAQEIKQRLAQQADVADVSTRIKFNYHTGGQQLIVQFNYRGIVHDATLEEAQPDIKTAQARENVTLSGAYMTHDGRVIVHKSFLDAASQNKFNIVKYRSTKQFLIAVERYIRLRKRDEYRAYKFRVDIRACFRSRGTTLPEPWPSMAGIFKHAKRLVGRAKLHEPTLPKDVRKNGAKPGEHEQN